MEIRLSPYGAASTRPSPVNAMMAAFAEDFRDDIDINLGVGYVNEDTIPEALIREALDAVLADRQRYRQAFNYGGPRGSANLIASLRRFRAAPSRPGAIPPEVLASRELIIGPSGATSLLDAAAEVLPRGIVVTADPMYYIYTDALFRRGFEVVAAPEDSAGVDPLAVRAKVQALGERATDISFFYYVTVNNPTCSILSDARREQLVELAAELSARQGRRIPVFFDTAYELLLHDPAVPPCASAMQHDRTDLVYELGTLSKVLAPALRCGYLIGPPGPFMDALVQKTSDVGFSAPLVSQEMASYLIDRHIDGQIEAVNAGYRRKAQAVKACIETELGPYLEDCRGGSAGFYFYLTLDGVETHTDAKLFRYCARTTGHAEHDGPPENPFPRVVYIPGAYCVHPGGDLVEAGGRQLRLSYGFEETAAIERAIAILREGIEYARGG